MGLQAASETSDRRVSESSQAASDLCLEDHTHTHALAMEDIGSDDGLDSVTNGVAKVDEVAKAGLLLVDRNDVGFGRDGGADDGEEEGLGGRASCESSPGAGGASRGSEDGRVDLGDA